MKSNKTKYGINEQKQAELNQLSTQVQDATFKVDELQAVVDSLTAKSQTFQGFLTEADNNRSTALTNLNLMNQVVSQVEELQQNSAIVLQNAESAHKQTDRVVAEMAELVNELIFACEFIDKAEQAVIRKKTLVPLISDELVKVMTTAVSDGNNAVALMLTALQSCYAAQASGKDSHEIMRLEHDQTAALHKHMTSSPSLPEVGKLQAIAGDVTLADAGVVLQLAVVKTANDECQQWFKALEATRKSRTELERQAEQVGAGLDTLKTYELDQQQEELQRQLIAAEKEYSYAKSKYNPQPDTFDDKYKPQFDQAQQALNAVTQQFDEITAALKAQNDAAEQVQQQLDGIQNAIALLSQTQTGQQEELAAASQKLADAYDELEWAKEALTEQVVRFDSRVVANARNKYLLNKTSLYFLLNKAYLQAVDKYDSQLQASRRVTKELETASKKLVLATNSLSALQAGLEAATAAALAA
ncbi:MAG TPA: hypothetical protein VMH83_11290 [Candidatus Acidoferrum sp.]|nr:hypothetical protein [Candidatus Acidoferrum sp.]